MTSLFDFIPAAASADPHTSHAAAREHTVSGARGANCSRVLAGIVAHPGRTSRELAELLGMDRHEVARRTADLMHAGRARQGEPRACSVGGRECVTWWSVTWWSVEGGQ